MNITKSFLLDFIKYKRGDECGNLMVHKWVNGNLLPGSDAMKLGTYYEYLISGAVPKDGIIPKPVMQASNKNKMYAEYQRAWDNAADTKHLLFEVMGFKLIEAGKTHVKEGFAATPDLILQATKTITFSEVMPGYFEAAKEVQIKKGTKVYFDLKYSGLLYNEWEEMGWMFKDKQKAYHKWQARQYHYVTGLPFFYLVRSPANTEDIELFRMDLTKEDILDHIRESKAYLHEFELIRDTQGFEARPSYSKCLKCPIKDSCKDKHIFPHSKRIEL